MRWNSSGQRNGPKLPHPAAVGLMCTYRKPLDEDIGDSEGSTITKTVLFDIFWSFSDHLSESDHHPTGEPSNTMGLSIPSTDNYHISDYTRAKESNNVTDRQLVTHKWRQHRERKRHVLSHQQHTASWHTHTHKHQNRQMKLTNQTLRDHTHTHTGRRKLLSDIHTFGENIAKNISLSISLIKYHLYSFLNMLNVVSFKYKTGSTNRGWLV